MNELSRRSDLEVREVRSEQQMVRELSDRELGEVAGGACWWYEATVGRIIHGTYPPEH